MATECRVSSLPLSSTCLHPVSWLGGPWVASAEVAALHPAWRGYELLASCLARRGKVFPTEQLTAGEEAWGEVERAVGRELGWATEVTLYR